MTVLGGTARALLPFQPLQPCLLPWSGLLLPDSLAKQAVAWEDGVAWHNSMAAVHHMRMGGTLGCRLVT